jgi:phage terminase large subunit GpA-like protein
MLFCPACRGLGLQDKERIMSFQFPLRPEVPAGTLFLIMSVMTGENSLEVDVWGHGMGHRTYAVDQWEVEGDLDDPYAGNRGQSK